MLFLVLLAPLGALGLLVSMSSLERWQELERSPAAPPPTKAGPATIAEDA